MSSTTNRLNRIVVVDPSNVTQRVIQTSDIGSAAAITANTTAINTVTTNLANNYATSAAIAAAYYTKSQADAQFITPTAAQNLINASASTTIVTPTITPTASSTGANTSGTIAIAKSLFTYNAAAKVMSGDFSVTVPTVPDSTQISTVTVTLAAPSGVTYAAGTTFQGCLNGVSVNGGVYTPIQWLPAVPITVSGGNLIFTLLYQPNNATDSHTINVGFRTVSST